MTKMGTFLPFTGDATIGGPYQMPTFSDRTSDLIGRLSLGRLLTGGFQEPISAMRTIEPLSLSV